MLLDATGQSLQIVLAGAASTTELPWNVAYHEVPGGVRRSANGITTGDTAVDMLALSGNTSVQRQIRWFSVYNADTATAVVTIRLYNGSAARTVFKRSLAVGDTLEWSLEGGFRVGTVVADAASIAVGTLTEAVVGEGILVDGLRMKDASVKPVAGGAAWCDLSDCATGEGDTILGANLANAWNLRTAALSFVVLCTTTATPGLLETWTHTGVGAGHTITTEINHATNAHAGLSVVAKQKTTARTGGTLHGIESGSTSLAGDLNSVVYSDFCALTPTDGGGSALHSAFTVQSGHDRAFDLTLCATGEGVFAVADNLAVAWAIREGANAYITVCTTNSGEYVEVHKTLKHSGGVVDVSGNTTGTSYVSLADNVADGWSIRQGSNYYLTIVTTDGAEQIEAGKRLTTTDGVASGTKRVIGGIAYASTAASTAITGATETAAVFDAKYTMPANMMKAGTVLRIRGQGIHTATTGGETHDMALVIGTVTIAGKATIDPSNDDIFYFDATVVCRDAGATGHIVATGTQAHGAEGVATALPFKLASSVIDTTGALVVGVQIDRQGTATDSDSARLDELVVEIVG